MIKLQRSKSKAKSIILGIVALALVCGGATYILAVGDAHDAIAASPTESSTTEVSAAAQFEDESVHIGEQPGHPAVGPVPDYLETEAAAGSPMAKVAKHVWQNGGQVIPLPDGRYLIPMPEKIPAGIDYPTEQFPARSATEKVNAEQAGQSKSPIFLDPSERAIWEQVLQSGEAFSIQQGADGYRHIIRGDEVEQ